MSDMSRPRAGDGREPVMTADEINEFLGEVYPQVALHHGGYRVTEVFRGGCVIRLDATERHVRPGGSVSGPALFALADLGGYACVLSQTGREAMSVTTSLTINFMRKAGTGPVDAHCRIMKMGRALMVFEADIVFDGKSVAHATGTYSIPPARS